MQAQSRAARCLTAIFLSIGTTASFCSYSQGIADPSQWVAAPPFALGMASGAHFGAHVSAADPAIRCFGRRSFSCGAHFDPRPILAGALIGGLLGVLSTPAYSYQPPLMHPVGSPQHASDAALVNSDHGARMADNWQQFGNPRPDSIEENSAIRSRFVDRWQQFFEPAR